MSNRISFALLLLASSSLSVYCADFRTGQAARAVIGQPSFSAREAGVAARALSVSKGVLYVADTSNRLLAFNVARLSGGKTCAVCVTTPASVVSQSVMAGVASSAAYGRTVVIADAKSHRVMIWRGSTPKPDVVISVADPVSVAFDGQRLFVGDATMHRVLVWKSLPVSDDQAADAVLGAEAGNDSPAADTMQTPVALASDGFNLFVADAAWRRVLVYSPGDVPLSARQVLNAASLIPGSMAPGTLVSIEYSSTVDANSMHVLLDGLEMPLLDITGDTLQTQLPYTLSGSAGSLVVRADRVDGTSSLSDAVNVTLVPASPGIYAFGGKEPRAGLLLHGESEPLTTESPAKTGEVLTVWAAGLGAVDSGSGSKAQAGLAYDGTGADVQTPVSAMVNGQPATVLSAQLPEAAVGVYEVKIQLPDGLPPGGTATLVLSQNDVRSNAVIFPVAADH